MLIVTIKWLQSVEEHSRCLDRICKMGPQFLQLYPCVLITFFFLSFCGEGMRKASVLSFLGQSWPSLLCIFPFILYWLSRIWAWTKSNKRGCSMEWVCCIAPRGKFKTLFYIVIYIFTKNIISVYTGEEHFWPQESAGCWRLSKCS